MEIKRCLISDMEKDTLNAIILVSNFKQQYTHVILLWYLCTLNDYKIGLTIDIGSATLFHGREYHYIRAAGRFQKIPKRIRRVVSRPPLYNIGGVDPDLHWGFGCDCLSFVCLFICFIQANLMLLHGVIEL